MFDQHEMPAAQAHLDTSQRLKARSVELDRPYVELYESRLRLRQEAAELRQHIREFEQLDVAHSDVASWEAELLRRVSDVQTQTGLVAQRHQALVVALHALQDEGVRSLATLIGDTDPQIHGRPRSQHLQIAIAQEMATLGETAAAVPTPNLGNGARSSSHPAHTVTQVTPTGVLAVQTARRSEAPHTSQDGPTGQLPVSSGSGWPFTLPPRSARRAAGAPSVRRYRALAPAVVGLDRQGSRWHDQPRRRRQ